MYYYEWKIKVDKQTWAQGTAPDKDSAIDMISVYLMQYHQDWEDKLEVVIRRRK